MESGSREADHSDKQVAAQDTAISEHNFHHDSNPRRLRNWHPWMYSNLRRARPRATWSNLELGLLEGKGRTEGSPTRPCQPPPLSDSIHASAQLQTQQTELLGNETF